MRVSAVAAVASNGVIGNCGRLPWKLPEDMRRFKALTLGHTLVMGRKTAESIGWVLPGRSSIVISRNAGSLVLPPGARAVSSWPDALAACRGEDEVFVIGGAEVYALTAHAWDRLYLTRLDAAAAGDVLFPAVDMAAFTETSRERGQGCTFSVYEAPERSCPA
jgi:dihydrofolate reductase